MKNLNATSSLGNSVHRETLTYLTSEGLLEGTSLALNVEQKIRRGRDLTPVEAGILNLCITREQLQFIRKHGL